METSDIFALKICRTLTLGTSCSRDDNNSNYKKEKESAVCRHCCWDSGGRERELRAGEDEWVSNVSASLGLELLLELDSYYLQDPSFLHVFKAKISKKKKTCVCGGLCLLWGPSENGMDHQPGHRVEPVFGYGICGCSFKVESFLTTTLPIIVSLVDSCFAVWLFCYVGCPNNALIEFNYHQLLVVKIVYEYGIWRA